MPSRPELLGNRRPFLGRHCRRQPEQSYLLQAYIEKGDGRQRIAALVVGYVLEVSPAPGTATFNDVPTSHSFFQFVEALSASDITAGCGAGNFCPDAPLTRGQMAAFLAKGLGLQWP